MPNDIGPLRLSEILRQAINEFSQTGYHSEDQLRRWVDLIRAAAERRSGAADAELARLRKEFEALFERLMRGKVLDYVPEVGRYTLAMIRPELRAELDRRILAAADLIKLHRREAIETTLRRFQGWATSIPAGGEGAIDKREVRAHVAKDVKTLAFERRRVSIDQGHKLVANIAEIVARGNNAIAAVWRSHWRQPGYNYRPDHKERDSQVYAVRGNWAIEKGLMTKGAGYLDEMTAPGQEINCRCYCTFLLSPRRLPDSMLTRKGHAWIADSEKQAA